MTLLNRILGALLALVLLIGGLLVAVEVLLALIGRQHWLVPHRDWSAWLDEQTWEATPVRTILVAMVVVGVLLLLVGLRRGRPAVLPLAGATASGIEVQASRRGVEMALAEVATDVEGVLDADAVAGRRHVTIKATVGRPTANLVEQITSQVSARLRALGLADALRVRVQLIREEGR
jgi:hypothetical protein